MYNLKVCCTVMYNYYTKC